jgi:hypothetical protein
MVCFVPERSRREACEEADKRSYAGCGRRTLVVQANGGRKDCGRVKHRCVCLGVGLGAGVFSLAVASEEG